jgi:hypothetical protein
LCGACAAVATTTSAALRSVTKAVGRDFDEGFTR